MSRSLTVPVPPASRVVRWVAAVVLVVVLLVAGIRLGAILTARDPLLALADAAPVQQVQTVNGVYLGRIVAVDGDYIRLYAPAVVRETDGEGQEAPQMIVIQLGRQPFDLGGDVLIPRAQVLLVGNVAGSSALEVAYRQAIGDLPQPTPAPSASRSAP